VLMSLMPLKALRAVNARFEGGKEGEVMRESYKSSGACKARGSGAGERRRGEKFRPVSAGAGEMTKLTGDAHVAVTEGGGGRLGKA
jgi:hypothetical protein